MGVAIVGDLALVVLWITVAVASTSSVRLTLGFR
jgi:hypothetical protein